MAERIAPSRHAVKKRRRRRRRIRLTITILAVLAVGAGGYIGYRAWWGDSTSTQDKVQHAISDGLAAQRTGDLATARASFTKALKYDKNNKYAHYDLALVDIAESNLDGAETEYRAAIQSDPHFGSALFNLAILVQNKGDDQEAVSLYRRAIAANPTGPDAHLNLGLLLHAMGQKKAGDDELRIAQALGAKVPGSSSPTPSSASTS